MQIHNMLTEDGPDVNSEILFEREGRTVCCFADFQQNLGIHIYMKHVCGALVFLQAQAGIRGILNTVKNGGTTVFSD